MKKNEAIKRILDHISVHKIGEYPHKKLAEALYMAISALRALPEDKISPPCYQPEQFGDGCAYQCYDGDDEPIDKCKECPLCTSDKHRNQQEAEKNEPLTREELRGMAERCEAVYVANINGTPLFRGKKHCAAVLDVKPAFGSSDMHIQAIYGDRLTLWEDDYGKTWIAYGRPPKEG